MLRRLSQRSLGILNMSIMRTARKLRFTTAFCSLRKNYTPYSSQTISKSFNHREFTTQRKDAQYSKEEAEKENWQGRVNLAAAFRGLEMMDFNEGICNHLSLIVPAANGDGEVMLMNAFGFHWKEIEPYTLVGVNGKGETVEGDGEIEISAKTIHLGIHQERPDAKCAFHLHTKYTTALGMLEDLPFGMYHQNSLIFYNDFAYDREYGGFSMDLNEGQRIAKHIKDKTVLFMCNHGVMVVGENVADVFYYVYYLERACMYQALAMSTGRKLMEIPEEVAKSCKVLSDRDIQLYSLPFFESIKRVTGVKTSKNQP